MLRAFSQNMVLEYHFTTWFHEVGWDSNKPGYDGLIEVANRLMLNCRTRADAIEAAVRVLRSLFPPFLLELYKMLVAPIGGCKVAAMMVGLCGKVQVPGRKQMCQYLHQYL